MLALRVASALSKSALRPAAASFAFARPSAAAFFSTKYTDAHEYIKVEGKLGTIGITDFAQNSLGDVVFVELPDVGQTFAKGCVSLLLSCSVNHQHTDTRLRACVCSDAFGAVESVKAASDVYVPVGGKIVEVNEVRPIVFV